MTRDFPYSLTQKPISKFTSPTVSGVAPETRRLTFPQIPDFYAIIYIAVTVAILAYSSLFGIAPILLLYAIWLPHFYYRKLFILTPTKDLWPALIIMGWTVGSIIWSDAPLITARAGFEYASMILCAIIVARCVRTTSLIKGLTLGTALTLAATLVSGRYGRDYFSGTYALVGFFGSKNQVGFMAEIGLFAALTLLWTRRSNTEKLLFAVIPAAICGLCLILSRSSSSYASLIFSVIVTATTYVLIKLPRRHLMPLFLTAFLFVCVMIGLGFYAGWDEFIIQILGKDTTLTGRTYLWAEGLKIGADAPILGHGYAAFWVPGQQHAERYWREFMIFSQSGFHFHNLFIQTFVDLGVIGGVIMACIVLINLLQSFRAAINARTGLYAFFSLGIASMLLIRGFVEVDSLGPFGIGSLLCFLIVPHLAAALPTPAKVAPTREERRPLIKVYVSPEGKRH